MKKLIVTMIMVSLTIAGLFAMDGKSTLKDNIVKSESLTVKVMRNAGDKLNIKIQAQKSVKGMDQIHAILSKKSEPVMFNHSNAGYFVKENSAGGIQ